MTMDSTPDDGRQNGHDHRGWRNTAYKHGQWQTRTYIAWQNMKKRSRGNISRHWLAFEGFYADMGDAPAGLAIVRKNPQWPWDRFNCEWGVADHRPCATTKRNGDPVGHTFEGRTLRVWQWAAEYGTSIATMSKRWSRTGRPDKVKYSRKANTEA